MMSGGDMGLARSCQRNVGMVNYVLIPVSQGRSDLLSLWERGAGAVVRTLQGGTMTGRGGARPKMSRADAHKVGIREPRR